MDQMVERADDSGRLYFPEESRIFAILCRAGREYLGDRRSIQQHGQESSFQQLVPLHGQVELCDLSLTCALDPDRSGLWLVRILGPAGRRQGRARQRPPPGLVTQPKPVGVRVCDSTLLPLLVSRGELVGFVCGAVLRPRDELVRKSRLPGRRESEPREADSALVSEGA